MSCLLLHSRQEAWKLAAVWVLTILKYSGNDCPEPGFKLLKDVLTVHHAKDIKLLLILVNSAAKPDIVKCFYRSVEVRIRHNLLKQDAGLYKKEQHALYLFTSWGIFCRTDFCPEQQAAACRLQLSYAESFAACHKRIGDIPKLLF